ncbi:MAG: FAD-binding oxidoreductase, partial [Ralstonia sp.]|nr:FAD-binding oxidoreductase [Ralstonia sp.]
MRFDTLVLGAGIVGVSVAVHLQKRGRAVALVDRRAPGFETSFGNAGLIQREGVYPYAFPRDLSTLLRYAGNTSADVQYHPGDLPRLLPFLWQYWRNSHPTRHAAIAREYAPLIAHSVSEHRALAEAAGAMHLIRPSGWIKVFRNAATQDKETRNVERWQREYGVAFEALDPARLRSVEPHLDTSLLGGLRYTEADSVSDPNALVTAYAKHFEQLGGRLFEADANTLTPNAPWLLQTKEGELRADNVVVAMGPWADVLTS